jgi:hypothetical protein
MLAGFLLVGCNDASTKKADSGTATATTTVAAATNAPKHSGWWCTEHGIPEEECLVCLHSEEDLKKKGDWCEHNFAKSQCFACNPKMKEHFAAKYRAKYGKEPPPADENPPTKNPD